ncbi:hypothetical protein Mp_7g06520 [Marchantia polymorpha subsp. ruderalis]|uniref:Uncharacterized protein n=2 Tax=Marchantia polymorpha TaxID=3197 RepID=A0AAF6BWS8_MARPO|nr:hypothetical protein MARPO_0057s0015 [Marchantia polymorpha]BBN16462.1 hypothetical protein Mp_7g06520 [Marchantia polymorpha subsp. ruderalis]|eukprot:PTQ37375.1 hypothetical protein MARPO_0057s0015 [Marchantia polymorpha]
MATFRLFAIWIGSFASNPTRSCNEGRTVTAHCFRLYASVCVVCLVSIEGAGLFSCELNFSGAYFPRPQAAQRADRRQATLNGKIPQRIRDAVSAFPCKREPSPRNEHRGACRKDEPRAFARAGCARGRSESLFVLKIAPRALVRRLPRERTGRRRCLEARLSATVASGKRVAYPGMKLLSQMSTECIQSSRPFRSHKHSA